MIKSKTTRIAKLIQLQYDNKDINETIREDMKDKYNSLAINSFDFYNTEERGEGNKGYMSMHRSGWGSKRIRNEKLRLNKIEMKILKQVKDKEKNMSEM